MDTFASQPCQSSSGLTPSEGRIKPEEIQLVVLPTSSRSASSDSKQSDDDEEDSQCSGYASEKNQDIHVDAEQEALSLAPESEKPAPPPPQPPAEPMLDASGPPSTEHGSGEDVPMASPTEPAEGAPSLPCDAKSMADLSETAEDAAVAVAVTITTAAVTPQTAAAAPHTDIPLASQSEANIEDSGAKSDEAGEQPASTSSAPDRQKRPRRPKSSPAQSTKKKSRNSPTAELSSITDGPPFSVGWVEALDKFYRMRLWDNNSNTRWAKVDSRTVERGDVWMPPPLNLPTRYLGECIHLLYSQMPHLRTTWKVLPSSLTNTAAGTERRLQTRKCTTPLPLAKTISISCRNENQHHYMLPLIIAAHTALTVMSNSLEATHMPPPLLRATSLDFVTQCPTLSTQMLLLGFENVSVPALIEQTCPGTWAQLEALMKEYLVDEQTRPARRKATRPQTPTAAVGALPSSAVEPIMLAIEACLQEIQAATNMIRKTLLGEADAAAAAAIRPEPAVGAAREVRDAESAPMADEVAEAGVAESSTAADETMASPTTSEQAKVHAEPAEFLADKDYAKGQVVFRDVPCTLLMTYSAAMRTELYRFLGVSPAMLEFEFDDLLDSQAEVSAEEVEKALLERADQVERGAAWRELKKEHYRLLDSRLQIFLDFTLTPEQAAWLMGRGGAGAASPAPMAPVAKLISLAARVGEEHTVASNVRVDLGLDNVLKLAGSAERSSSATPDSGALADPLVSLVASCDIKKGEALHVDVGTGWKLVDADYFAAE